MIKHGYSKKDSKVYRAWKLMRSRCNNPKGKFYKYYGGRGIKVCERWDDFSNFLKDMGEPSDKLLSLDRINNDGDYEPQNCRWATSKEQSLNQRPRKDSVVLNGVRSSFAGKALGSDRHLITQRLKNGWDIEMAFRAPCRSRKSGNILVFNGEYAMDASKRLGGCGALVHLRILKGWSIERAFTKPARKRNKETEYYFLKT